MSYEELLVKAHKSGLKVRELSIPGFNGRIKGNRIAISKDIPTTKEKACVLAEELGHYYTTTGNIIDLQDARNRKQELQARLWAYDNQVGLFGIIKAYNANCTNLHEMAEYLEVTEQFMSEALECYRGKYGERIKVDNYIIFFEPYLGVMKMI